jgi:phage baseplate assembly protein V
MKTQIRLMVGRAVLTAIKDGGGIQVAQLKGLADEAFDGVPRVQEFGFSSNPPDGTDAIMVAVGGSRESLVVIATDHKSFRIKNLASGESVVYTDDGTKIHLKKAGQIEIVTATKVTITAPDVEMSGNLKVTGTTHLVGKVTADDEVAAAKDISSSMNVKATLNVQAALVQAAGYAGPAGGAPGMVTTQDITTTGNVVGGGTSLAAIKAAYNAHTHVENGTGGGVTNPTGSTV